MALTSKYCWKYNNREKQGVYNRHLRYISVGSPRNAINGDWYEHLEFRDIGSLTSRSVVS